MLKLFLLFTNELHNVKYDHLCFWNIFILYGITASSKADHRNSKVVLWNTQIAKICLYLLVLSIKKVIAKIQ